MNENEIITLKTARDTLRFSGRTGGLVSLRSEAAPDQEFIEAGEDDPVFAVQYLDDRRQFRLKQYSNLGALERFSFDNLLPEGRSSNPQNQERFNEAFQAAKSFAETPEGWLIFTGPSGSGKSHLAAAIVNECIEKGTPAFYISTPDLPVIIGSIDLLDLAIRVTISGHYAYVADMRSGLQIIDVSVPESPLIVGFVETPGYARGVALSKIYAFVADSESGLIILKKQCDH